MTGRERAALGCIDEALRWMHKREEGWKIYVNVYLTMALCWLS